MTSHSPRPASIEVGNREDAIRLCSRLQEAIAQLTDVLGQETQLLKSGAQSRIGDVQDEKLAHTRVFLKYFTAFKEYAAFIGANAPSHTDRIRQSLRNFGLAVQVNLDALEAARAVSQGTVQTIFDAVKKAISGPATYGAPIGNAPSVARPTALAFDQTL